MSLDVNRTKQINTCYKMIQENPGKYCGANLVLMAMETDSEGREHYKESARDVGRCKRDAEENGSCYCGNFLKGEVE